MDVEQRERVKELFQAALEREESERSAFLNQACPNDAEVRRAVEALLSGEKRDIPSAPAARPPVNKPASDGEVSTFSRGQVISGRFKVLRFIANGGMGEVYEARDLDRDVRVALKTIRAEVASDAKMLKRFKQEIELSLRVSHRNVCRVFDLERYQPPEASGKPDIVFLSMELLDGETLADRLLRQGRMTCQEALPIIRQLADGLAAAHQVGVVHCDFKPGNVMLVGEGQADVGSNQSTQSLARLQVALAGSAGSAAWRAVITDFGLARAMRPTVNREAIEESLKTGGPLIGTLPYMAPEQLEGRSITPASDVYALGLVIYEMVTGRLPFSGPTPMVAAYKRLTEPPASPRPLAPDVDPGLESVILNCLQKEPTERYANAVKVVAALSTSTGPSPLRKRRVLRAVGRWAGGAAVLSLLAAALIALIPQAREAARNYLFGGAIPGRKNLVVLPFRAVDHSPEEEARCDGFTETITAKLAQAPSVEVAPAESVREQQVGTFEKARTQLGANLVLYGSWQQAGESAVINLVLVEVDRKPEKQLRSETVKGTASDMSGLQDRVVLAALRMLHVGLSPDDARDLTAHTTNVLPAYDYYVQGIGYLQRYEKPENVDLAIRLFQRAIAEDGSYAQAQAALAQAYWYKFTASGDPQWVVQAQSAVKAAESLNSKLPEVQLAIAEQYRRSGMYAEAVTAFLRDTDLDPANVEAYQGLAQAYDSLGKTPEAERALRHAVGLRPGCWSCYNALGEFYYGHARFLDAVQAWQKVIDLTPDNVWGYLNVGDVYLNWGEFEKAGDYFHRALAVDPNDADSYSNLGTVSFYTRHYEEGVRYCQKAIGLRPKQYDYWGNLGDAHQMIPADTAEAAKDYRQAILLGEEQLKVNPRNAMLLSLLALYHARIGEADRSGDLLAEGLNLDPNSPNVMYLAGLVHLANGEGKESLNWLEQAVHAGYPRGLIAADPELDRLHSDPAFERLKNEAQTYR
jgi:serine/threonine protein kinase/tetratricopeptide (TPR) repeat protein